MTTGSVKLFGLGLSLIITSFTWKIYQGNVLHFKYQPEIKSQSDSFSQLASINIPKFNVNLDISSSNVADGKWEISKTGASHLIQSALPGQNSNIVIYGHNKDSLFGPIRWLEVGDNFTLTNKQGSKFSYQVTKFKIVSPDQISDILPTNKEQVTLFTCTGFLDSKRHLVIASPTHI